MTKITQSFAAAIANINTTKHVPRIVKAAPDFIKVAPARETMAANRNKKSTNNYSVLMRKVETIKPTAVQRKEATQKLKTLGIAKGEVGSKTRCSDWYEIVSTNPAANGVYQVSVDGDAATLLMALFNGKKWYSMETGLALDETNATWFRGLTTAGYAAFLLQVATKQRELIAIPKNTI